MVMPAGGTRDQLSELSQLEFVATIRVASGVGIAPPTVVEDARKNIMHVNTV
jgi:hypothetical protein